MINQPKNKGFTLVELMVSVAITAVLMVGMASFFSSTFRNMFLERGKVAGSQSQFVVSTILDKKFVNAAGFQGAGANYAVIQNDTEDGSLPFSYVGTTDVGGTTRIVFKDFLVFNGKSGNVSSFGTGYFTDKNPGGLTAVGAEYYVTMPSENRIYKCVFGLASCVDFGIGGLNHPMDITTDGVNLFVTDGGYNRVIKIEDLTGAKTVTPILESDLNFPTGIEYHSPGPGKEYLFVSDTYNHLVKRIDLSDSSWKTVAGEGNDENCGDPANPDGRDHTALYCKLNFPTGVVVSSEPGNNSLYISDTGNGRILRLSDPGPPKNNTPSEQIAFSFDSDTAVEKIAFSPFSNEAMSASSMTGPGSSLNGSYSNIAHELTTASIFSTYNGPCAWNNSGNELWIETNPSTYLSDGDLIAIEDGGSGTTEIYEAITVPSSDSLLCIQGAAPAIVSYRAYKILLNRNLVGVGNGDPVFKAGKSGHSETIDLIFQPNSFVSSGFKAIDINVYEFGNVVPVETHEHFVRVGDEDRELGTDEDIMTVAVSGLAYPTGLGWSGTLQASTDADVSTSDFFSFDYTSDFEVRDLSFTTYDLGSPGSPDLLKLDFEAKLGTSPTDEAIWKKYSLSANLNK